MKILLIIFFLTFGLTSVTWAKKDNAPKGPHPNENAYEHANENARFKRGDEHPPESQKKNKDKKKSKKDKQPKHDDKDDLDESKKDKDHEDEGHTTNSEIK